MSFVFFFDVGAFAAVGDSVVGPQKDDGYCAAVTAITAIIGIHLHCILALLWYSCNMKRDDLDTRGEARITSVVVEDIAIDDGVMSNKGTRVATSGLVPSWRPEMSRRNGYVPFDAKPSRERDEIKRRVRGYIKDTGPSRRLEALAYWRKRTGHLGIRRAAHDATIEAIAKANPQTHAELLAVPGVSEMLLDIAGFEILELLRKS